MVVTFEPGCHTHMGYNIVSHACALDIPYMYGTSQMHMDQYKHTGQNIHKQTLHWYSGIVGENRGMLPLKI